MMCVIGQWCASDVLPLLVNVQCKKGGYEIYMAGRWWKVNTHSQRYKLFYKNPVCVSCGIVGTIMQLEQHRELTGFETPHFNLYAVKGGRLVIMTKDHIIPKSQGGKSSMSNYQTMCYICNGKKGNVVK